MFAYGNRAKQFITDIW